MAAEIEEVRRKIRVGEFGVSNVSLFSFNHDFNNIFSMFGITVKP